MQGQLSKPTGCQVFAKCGFVRVGRVFLYSQGHFVAAPGRRGVVVVGPQAIRHREFRSCEPISSRADCLDCCDEVFLPWPRVGPQLMGGEVRFRSNVQNLHSWTFPTLRHPTILCEHIRAEIGGQTDRVLSRCGRPQSGRAAQGLTVSPCTDAPWSTE